MDDFFFEFNSLKNVKFVSKSLIEMENSMATFMDLNYLNRMQTFGSIKLKTESLSEFESKVNPKLFHWLNVKYSFPNVYSFHMYMHQQKYQNGVGKFSVPFTHMTYPM